MPKKRKQVIIKQDPEDFLVEELTELQAGQQGQFGLYKLEKVGWTTIDALQAIRRRWRIDFRRMAWGGMKDRHAHTIQYFTIFRGPQRAFNQQRIEVTYLGQVDQPYSSENILANRFCLVVRGLDGPAISAAHAAADDIRRVGVPNYFDDQRFGSVDGPDQGFVAKQLILGRYEEALRLALLARYEHDRAEQKMEKKLLHHHWGDWMTLKAKLPRGHSRSLVDYLCHHPQDFRGAVARLRPELRGLYLSVYQSHLWNRILGRWLEERAKASQLAWVSLRLGTYPVPKAMEGDLAQAWRQLQLPLPSARVGLEENDPRLPLLAAVLDEEHLTLEQFKLKGLPDMFFFKGERAAAFWPEQVSLESANDQRRPGQLAMRLKFDLPRGCYATMVVKRLTQTTG